MEASMGNPRTKHTDFNAKFSTVIIEWGLSEETNLHLAVPGQ